MTTVWAVRLVRYVGWMVLAGSIGVIVGSIVVQAVGGPVASDVLWPSPRLWRYFGTTLWMAAVATAMALLLSVPAVIALTQARRAWQRRILRGLVVLPLVTMPAVFAYAWMLLATRRGGWVAAVMEAVGWNTPGVEPLQAAWVLATWLWPIPALVLVSSYSHLGAPGFQLARLDASSRLAFLRGALPLMRAPLAAALAVTFILAATDSSVPPLMGATEVWAVEMLAEASVASSQPAPIGYLFWRSWPMLAAIALAIAAAIPGIRRMEDWLDDVVAADLGDSASTGSNGVWVVANLLAAAVTVLPIVVFCTELAGGRSPLPQILSTAYRTFRQDGLATLLVAVLTAACAMAIAVALLHEAETRAPKRTFARAAMLMVAVSAVLPPELTGTALTTFFSRISDPSGWNIYDHTPWSWIAAMVARFGFIPVAVVWLLSRRTSSALVAQARSDGASESERLAHLHLPLLRRSLLAAGMMTACLTVSEVGAAVLVQPPRFFGGSLAVQVDGQMHYGRQDETIALSLMLIVPAVAGAIGATWLVGRPGRIRSADDARSQGKRRMASGVR